MRIEAGGVGLEVAVEGEGRPVVLLHGFPDSSALWRHQTPALVGAGFRTIAPDLRGFGASDRPDAVDAYSLAHSIGDVIAILDHLDVERAHVVGHDWGAALAWAFATFVPERVDHLSVLSVGHPASFRDAGIEQRQRSWYMLLFQFEGVAERWMSDDDFARFRAWSGHPDIETAVADLSRPGALTAALNWYRANVPPASLVDPPLELPPVTAPTLGIWSSGDFALVEEQMTASDAHVAAPWRYERLDGPGHWMQLEAPDDVNRLLLDFLPS